jgi:hypothetical protein
MAKLSSINKNERRKKLAKKYAGRYAKLKAMAKDQSLDDSAMVIQAAFATVAKPLGAHALITANSGCAVSNCAILPIRA